ncbi:MAG: TonB-dependent receptor, partial [Ginsengibacter sp.]
SFIGVRNFGAPAHSGNIWLKYKMIAKRYKGFSFGAGYQYMGKRNGSQDSDKSKFLPCYNLLDAALGYDNQKCCISLNVYNITDASYAILGYFSPASNDWRYIPGEPLNFRVSVGIKLLK